MDWHNIVFKLGDPYNDGHGMTREYHISISHSIPEVQKAYDEAIKILGWDYLKVICSEYEDCTLNNDQYEDINSKLNINIEKYLPFSDSLEDLKIDGYCYLGNDSFIGIYFAIISSQIKDFKWKYRSLDEEWFEPLDGAGYGLFSH